jgi:phage regulator Rha-like protein
MIDDNARMLAQEFFYTKYKQTGSERYFSIFEFLQGKGRVAECPCVHNEWITVTPDGYIGFCSPHGAILGALNGSNARSLVTENIKQVEAVRREKCSSCSQYMYEVNRYGLVLLVQDQINESRRITS